MTVDSVADVKTSSNPESTENLSTKDDTPWTSSGADNSPTVTLTLSTVDSLVDTVFISGVTNVKEVKVTVIDTQGDEVNTLK